MGDRLERFRVGFLNWGREAFGVDLRTLACARMAFATLILSDLAVRSTCLVAHYTDQGAFPLDVYHLTGVPFVISFHAMSGEAWFQAVLFFLNGLVAVALLVGWRTRLATALCWLFMLSLHNRNYLLLNGGDAWMRLMLFWAIFIPWGERWSVDSHRVARRDDAVFSVATAGMVMQVFWVYIMAGLFKVGDAWWVEGSATQLSLELAQWSGERAHFALYYPELLKFLTFAVLAYEIVGPFLLFSPVWYQPLRTLSVAGFVGFHVGLAVFIEIGLFPYVGMVSAFCLMPALFWKLGPLRRLERALDRFWAAPREPGLPKSRPYKPSRLTTMALVLVVLHAGVWNAASWNKEWSPPPVAQVPAYLLRLDQYWALFAPEPPRSHYWFMAVATLSDGRTVDLLRGGGPVRWELPTTSEVYGNQRWKRLLVSCTYDFGASTRKPLVRYLFHYWSRRFPDIQSIQLLQLNRNTNLNFEDEPPFKRILVRMRRDEL